MKINKCFFEEKYVSISLNDKVRRYTSVISSEVPLIKFIVNNGYFLLGNDSKLNYQDLQSVGMTYGCCERKLLTVIEDKKYVNSEIVLYSRWVPCEKCQIPLLLVDGIKEIYSLYDDQTEKLYIKKNIFIEPKKLAINRRYKLIRY